MKISVHETRGNINILFENPGHLEASPIWQLGGRRIQFVWMPPGEALALPDVARNLVKVIGGFLIEPDRRAFCRPKGMQNVLFEGKRVVAGSEGAFVAVISEKTLTVVRSMTELQFSGPLAEALQWRTFHEQFGHVTDAFEGEDAYIGPGFHLQSDTGEETCYLNIWTAGKGVDLTTHNHAHDPSPAAPAFAETHLVVSNGTGQGGMYECDEPGSQKTRQALPSGYEHGPYFDVDAEGLPVLLGNGAVSYPWHGWEAGTDDDSEQAYDLVFAFETRPSLVRVFSA
ncbi:MAG: hypothetical protein JJ934_16060 [Pseudomonadales bacterium]|nr:hypothetical protein [Pseudomonadales bacterium]MBO6594708.1 hypothetical protein [Pseudomonadales bacterium]MBO6658407.1 hypothetical protein [Pseudomonadales bacterium]MBO6701213.1 hypothetical protein [Pseudomonadales bacterium]MBO6821733.1 hypothetical protein [Pseudomonadales bacterium]